MEEADTGRQAPMDANLQDSRKVVPPQGICSPAAGVVRFEQVDFGSTVYPFSVMRMVGPIDCDEALARGLILTRWQSCASEHVEDQRTCWGWSLSWCTQ